MLGYLHWWNRQKPVRVHGPYYAKAVAALSKLNGLVLNNPVISWPWKISIGLMGRLYRMWQSPSRFDVLCVNGVQQCELLTSPFLSLVCFRSVAWTFLFENGHFISDYAYRPHVFGKTVTENASFQKRSPEWRTLKTLATRLRVEGRKRRLSNTMM